jgi:prevent-host-death family protein
MYITQSIKEVKMSYPLEYSPTELKKNSSEIFNQVQRDPMVLISSKTRPDMVLMTLENYEREISDLNNKIRQLTDVIKSKKI